MLIKLLGSILVISACTAAGYVLSRDSSRRPSHLRDLQSLLQMMENEIGYMSNLLVDAFDNIAKTNRCEVSGIFKGTSRYMKENNGIPASSAWERTLDKEMPALSLNREDRGILISFGKMLGNSDLDGQLKNIRLTLQQLRLQEKKAEENKKKNELMYKRLGLLLGIAIVIVLI